MREHMPTGSRVIPSFARCSGTTQKHKGCTMTYFKTIDRAQMLADRLNYDDAEGWRYEVHASRGGFYVAIFDQDFEFVGVL